MLSASTKQSSAMAPPVDLRVIAALSLLLSLWLILIEPVINRDAIIYLRTAEAYLHDGALASFAIFDRPFLSIIMALLHQLTGLSLLHSGLVLSAVFYAVLSTAFVSIVRLLGGNRRVQIIAAIVILSHPMIGAGRDSIMRDAPFWAFSLLAFRTLLLYVRQPALKYNFQWFSFIVIATLFRFEGLFFAALAPVAVFTAASYDMRLKVSLRLLILPVVAMVIAGVAILLVQNTLPPGSHLFPNIASYVGKLRALPDGFAQLTTATADTLLVFSAKEDASIAAVAGLAAILLANLARAIMLPYVVVLIWGKVQHLENVIPRQFRYLINAHLVIALFYLGLFTLSNRFILERYCHIFTIFVALYLPFLVNAAWAPQRKPLTKILAALVLVGMVIDVAGSSGHRKVYKKDATQWLVSNTPETASIVSNSKYIAYFSGRETDWRNLGAITFRASELATKPALWRSADYIVVKVKPREFGRWAQFLEDNSLLELKAFPGKSHGKISIVKVPHQEKKSSGWRH